MRMRPGPAQAALALTLVLAPALAGCGGADEDDDEKSSARPSTSSSPSQAVSTPGVEVPPATGKKFSGDGYTFRAPKGWSDASKQAQSSNPMFDVTVAARPGDSGFPTNVNVVVSDADVDESSAKQLEQMSDSVKSHLKSLVPKLKVNPPTEVAGRPALNHEGPATKDGVDYYIDQFIAFKGDKAYTITFSFGRGTEPAQRDKVSGSVLSSWAWG